MENLQIKPIDCSRVNLIYISWLYSRKNPSKCGWGQSHHSTQQPNSESEPEWGGWTGKKIINQWNKRYRTSLTANKGLSFILLQEFSIFIVVVFHLSCGGVGSDENIFLAHGRQLSVYTLFLNNFAIYSDVGWFVLCYYYQSDLPKWLLRGKLFLIKPNIILFFVPGLFFGILFTNLDVRFIFEVFRNSYDFNLDFRTLLCSFYIIIYCIMLLISCIVYKLNLHPIIYILASMIYLPQIYTNALENHRPKIRFPYYSEYILVRLSFLVTIINKIVLSQMLPI